MSAERRYLQELIIAELGVPASFDPDTEIERRIEFLADQLRRTGATSLRARHQRRRRLRDGGPALPARGRAGAVRGQ